MCKKKVIIWGIVSFNMRVPHFLNKETQNLVVVNYKYTWIFGTLIKRNFRFYWFYLFLNRPKELVNCLNLKIADYK